MNKEAQFKRFFNLSSIITNHFPKLGAEFLNAVVKYSLGNYFLLQYLKRDSHLKIKSRNKLEKILVTADLNIGDAIIAISSVSALKEILPDSKIDIVVKKSTKNLIEGNPEVSCIYPVYNGAPFPSEADLLKLSNIVRSKNYDLIINFSPMISDKTFGKNNVINYSLMAAELIRNEFKNDKVNNIHHLAYRFIGEIFKGNLPADFGKDFLGSKIYLSGNAVYSAENFLLTCGIDRYEPVIMFNPDASSKFTRMPITFQVDLLEGLSELRCKILLGSGHVEKFIEQRIINSLSLFAREKVFIIHASMQLDEYTALIDYSDIFISGDTGNLHLAAARKYHRNDGLQMRNKTSVFSVFGGTPPKIYAYDSNLPGYLPANQDAPSRAFVAASECRNITCINKLAKTCHEVRCFKPLNPEEIVLAAADRIETAVENFDQVGRIILKDQIQSYKQIG